MKRGERRKERLDISIMYNQVKSTQAEAEKIKQIFMQDIQKNVMKKISMLNDGVSTTTQSKDTKKFSLLCQRSMI